MGMYARLALVVLSACLGMAVFAPLSWWWLAVVAWIPLFVALQGVKASHGLYLGLLHGVLFYGVTMSWLLNVFKGSETMMGPLVLILALFTGFFARGYALAHTHYRDGKRVWMTAVFAAVWWVAVEFFRCEIFTLKFPWMTPGVGLGPMWISPLLGVYGISFLLMLGAALLCHAGRSRIVGGVVLLMMLLSVMFPLSTPEIDEPIRVMAVQSEVTYLGNYMELTQGDDTPVDLIIWPEYGIPRDVRRDPRAMKKLLGLAQQRSAVMVLGTQTHFKDELWYNTALTIDGDGELGDHYKNHTVHFFDDGTAGAEARSVDTRLGAVGTPICFDCDYEDVIRRMTADGAEFFAIPSMDAEHWSAREHVQHGELFRHRAAENGRWMAVSSTSGLTQIIDPYGNRIGEIPLMEDGVLIGEIGKIHATTLYTQGGWLFPWFLMVVGACWVVVMFFQFVFKYRRQREANQLIK